MLYVSSTGTGQGLTDFFCHMKVTGSSRGIGAACAICLAEHGANVVINYLSSQDRAESIAEQCRPKGVDVLVIQADVTKVAEVKNMFGDIITKFGRIDIVYSNSGVEHFGKPDEVDESEFDAVG